MNQPRCLPGYCGQRFGITSAESSAKAMNAPATSARATACPVERASSTGGTYQGAKPVTGEAKTSLRAPNSSAHQFATFRTEVQ